MRSDPDTSVSHAPDGRAPGFSNAEEDRVAEEDRAESANDRPEDRPEDRPAPEDQPVDAPAPRQHPAVASQPTAVWADGMAEEYRDRWRQVQVRFLDDPPAAAEEAERLVGEVLDSLTQALAGHKHTLDGWRSAEHRDTEQLRVAVRGYRDLLDRVLAR